MKINCLNSECKNPNFIVKDGFYFRKDDSKKIQRFKCKSCHTKFSSSTNSLFYRTKKRRCTKMIEHLICSKSSIRRIACILKLDRKTVAKRLEKIEIRAVKRQEDLLEYFKNSDGKKVKELQFDDMISYEHTKMKPLSISLAVDASTRLILGAEVSRIPAFGLLAKRSVKKYGYRVNNHELGLERLFEKIYKSIDQNAIIKSDKHKTYPKYISKYFPSAEYRTYHGCLSCVAGQGELKRKGFDPLFILNHSCAMLRDTLNVLVRKTWCSTKRPDHLQRLLNIAIAYHNFKYLRFKFSPT